MIVTRHMVIPDYSAHDGPIVLEVTRETDFGGVDPREDDTLGHMVCWNRGYNFGSEPHDRNIHSEDELAVILAGILAEELNLDSDQKANVENFNSPYELMRAIKKHTRTVVLPIYLLDHGGLWLSTGRGYFDMIDPGSWDHGQAGIIYATSNDMKRNFKVQEITDEIMKEAENVLESEIERYSMFLQGDVWYYELKNRDTDELIDSCGGIYADRFSDLKRQIKSLIPEEFAHLADTLDENNTIDY
ncbi:hypothetical protein DMB44_04215 [Thermoplasma sp. Kam2015]|uniref:hypothetical protein n=1 Tax=Thermoplasma sp. Kam2015 TaxID=2094122 RepID=UPI000D939887|nr:hypothetical protein [Thermoplasma sp. Kam2015]PYB68545.1 hypothetical protein DMB44_04215 [Thermoplasma sp. Kam2015]